MLTSSTPRKPSLPSTQGNSSGEKLHCSTILSQQQDGFSAGLDFPDFS